MPYIMYIVHCQPGMQGDAFAGKRQWEKKMYCIISRRERWWLCISQTFLQTGEVFFQIQERLTSRGRREMGSGIWGLWLALSWNLICWCNTVPIIDHKEAAPLIAITKTHFDIWYFWIEKYFYIMNGWV